MNRRLRGGPAPRAACGGRARSSRRPTGWSGSGSGSGTGRCSSLAPRSRAGPPAPPPGSAAGRSRPRTGLRDLLGRSIDRFRPRHPARPGHARPRHGWLRPVAAMGIGHLRGRGRRLRGDWRIAATSADSLSRPAPPATAPPGTAAPAAATAPGRGTALSSGRNAPARAATPSSPAPVARARRPRAVPQDQPAVADHQPVAGQLGAPRRRQHQHVAGPTSTTPPTDHHVAAHEHDTPPERRPQPGTAGTPGAGASSRGRLDRPGRARRLAPPGQPASTHSPRPGRRRRPDRGPRQLVQPAGAVPVVLAGKHAGPHDAPHTLAWAGPPWSPPAPRRARAASASPPA